MTMHFHSDFAQTQISARLGEARTLRRGRNVVVSQRLARRAARAEQRADLAVARL
jgi:hypothetical protein